MGKIACDVWLYGPLAAYAPGGRSSAFANVRAELPQGSRLRDLLAYLSLPTEERGITFVNGCLSAMPHIQPDLDLPLSNSDRVAFFHLKSMWPYQYRDGAGLTPELKREMSMKTQPGRKK
jgi:hypothetical protein